MAKVKVWQTNTCPSQSAETYLRLFVNTFSSRFQKLSVLGLKGVLGLRVLTVRMS